MKILILSNWSSKIAEINDLTEPNKRAYAELHGYEFQNNKCPYTAETHVDWLKLLQAHLRNYDVVLTIGCDAIFVNQSIKIEDRIGHIVRPFRNDRGEIVYNVDEVNPQVVLAKDLTCCWPIQINNDVMIWPAGQHSTSLIDRLIRDADIWLKYPQLWQCHLWNLIQQEYRDSVRLVDPRLMNATFQPMTRQTYQDKDGVERFKLCRVPAHSSYQFGDWILHALNMSMVEKIEVLKWGLQYVGDGSWKPSHSIMGGHMALEEKL